MPIYRCNKCGFIAEDAQTAIHTQTPCGRCATPATVYGTVFFVEEIVKRLASTSRELQLLKTSTAPPSAATPRSDRDSAPPCDEALKRWFSERKISASFDPSHSDTSGFFDDMAIQIGDNYGLFAELIERVRYAYRKSHSNVTLELAQLSQKDGQAVSQLCRALYEHTFFSRFHYQKPEKIVRITLQTAPAIRNFFEGGWLEWYALIVAKRIAPEALLSSTRSVKVSFPNEDLHELDVVYLPPNDLPICIECKSGEFRRDIDKYLRLRKRLDIPAQRFLILSPELTPEQAQGLSAMYELSFVNLDTLKTHLKNLL